MMASLNGWQDIPSRRLPRLVFDVQQEADIKGVAEAVSVLLNNVGMKDIPASWVRKKNRHPHPERRRRGAGAGGTVSPCAGWPQPAA